MPPKRKRQLNRKSSLSKDSKMPPPKGTSILELTTTWSVDGELFGVRLTSKEVNRNIKNLSAPNSVQFNCSCCQHNFVLNVEIEKEEKPKLEEVEDLYEEIFPETEFSAQEEEAVVEPDYESPTKGKGPKKKKYWSPGDDTEPEAENGKRLECTQSGCNRVYSTRADFYHHVRFRHGKVTCDYCNETVSNKLVLMNHFNKVHKIGLKECPHCRRLCFANRFEKHIDTMHMRPKKYECHFCSYKTFTRKMLDFHLRRHFMQRKKQVRRKPRVSNTNEEGEKFSWLCECHGKTFESQIALSKHLNNGIYRPGKATCDYCNETVKNKVILMNHFNKVHKIGFQDCPHCFRPCFANRLQKHIDTMHLRPKQFECQICSYKTFSNNMLNFHMKSHSLIKKQRARKLDRASVTSGERSVKKERIDLLCECHGNIYSSKSALATHLRAKGPKILVPPDSEKYKPPRTQAICNVCGEYFLTKKQLTNHVEKKHKDYLWTCEKCDLIFLTYDLLHRHNQQNHKQGGVWHSCNQCDKKFMFPYLLRYHQRTHTGEKVQCPYPNCTAAYAYSGTMSRHKKEHRERGDTLINIKEESE